MSPTARRWTGYIAVAIAFAVACGFLANWQFSRNEERAHQLALVDANYDADPTPLSEVIAPGEAYWDSERWRPVELVGEYLTQDQVLVRNRAHGGTSAFEVLVPFRTTDGQVLVIDRGWVPPAEETHEPSAVPAPPAGEVTVIARLVPTEQLPRSDWSAVDGQIPTLNVPLIGDLMADNAGLIDGAYAQLAAEDPAPASSPQALERPSDDAGPHFSYAIQWILFGVMGFAFIWYMIRTERRAREEEEDQSLVPDPRRDQDMEEEDALLDALGR